MCLLFFKRLSNLDDNLISGTKIELWLPTPLPSLPGAQVTRNQRTFHAALMSWSKSQMLISCYIFSMSKTKPPHMLEYTLYDLALFFSKPTHTTPTIPRHDHLFPQAAALCELDRLRKFCTDTGAGGSWLCDGQQVLRGISRNSCPRAKRNASRGGVGVCFAIVFVLFL